MVKVLLLDPRVAGVSGDMLVGALLDLTGLTDIVNLVVDAVRDVSGCSDFGVKIYDVRKSGLRAKRVEVLCPSSEEERSGREVIELVNKCCSATNLSTRAREYAIAVVKELVEAEAMVHGISVDEVHLHELASLDTVFDIVCSAKLLDEMGVFCEGYRVYTTPPALGSGFVKCEHGLLPVPAPATLEILRRHNYRYSMADVPYELTTPTGAALLVHLTKHIVDFYPGMRVERVGYGAGARDVEGRPNVLRVVEGSIADICEDRVVVLETNVDDVPGEFIGYLVNKLLSQGAIDVVVLPGLGKKNRPVHVIKVLADVGNYRDLVELLMREVGTLGVRVSELSRVVASRVKVPIDVVIKGRKFTVTVKISRAPSGQLLRAKPEYEDLRRIAEETGLAIKDVYEEVIRQVRAKLQELDTGIG
ncbi:MAG: nickel pincer cofactor biosynthesis protein LarC [Thermoprotei archaeon]|nr:MAG: nickel pincer cofactor biosynthesis protein LarC [Thermoprotei archaeon]